MTDKREQIIIEHLRQSREVMDRIAGDAALVKTIVAIVEQIANALRNGGKVLLAGNGGSAADAQHIAAELIGRYKIERAPLAAIALTTDTSALTAIGNDYGFDQIFERQLRALARRGDVFIALSTSGSSRNIVGALKVARELGVITIGMTGAKGAQMQSLCDLVLVAPSDETPLIQQIHITTAHAICSAVERVLISATR